MGEPATQPIRVYAPLDAAATPEERVELLLAEIDRTRALERPAFALFSPTGSGYVNYVATETFEYLTRGNCASASIQYSVLPSALSLTKVDYATHQTRMLVNGITSRLLRCPPTSGRSSTCSARASARRSARRCSAAPAPPGPRGSGWTRPSGSAPRPPPCGGRSCGAPAPSPSPRRSGRAPFYLPRAIRDWQALPSRAQEQVRFLLLQNGDDPVPKFAAPLVWKRPDWLGPTDSRPPGSPRGTRWLPVVSFVTTFIDLQNALVPTPGVFQEGGHDYRLVIPETLKAVFDLDATDEQMERVEQALRARELEWEARRRWAKAQAKPTPERADAEDKVLSQLSEWTGREIDRDEVARIVGNGS